VQGVWGTKRARKANRVTPVGNKGRMQRFPLRRLQTHTLTCKVETARKRELISNPVLLPQTRNCSKLLAPLPQKTKYHLNNYLGRKRNMFSFISLYAVRDIPLCVATIGLNNEGPRLQNSIILFVIF
jgi:hypothetical protein